MFAKNEAKFSITASFYQMQDGKWKPDINKLKLGFRDQIIGVCEFDMARYIGRVPFPERASLVSLDYQVDTEINEKVLIGDTTATTGAYIEFRLSVMTPEEAKAAAQKAKKPKTAAQRVMSPSVTKSRAAALLSKNNLNDPATLDTYDANNRKTRALLEATIAIEEDSDEGKLNESQRMTPTNEKL